jgi:hypothetical protein
LSPFHPCLPQGRARQLLVAPMVIGLPNANGKPFMSGAANARSIGTF